MFDDVESLFLTRNSAGAKEWHFSQNSIFFHSIDDLDTAHTAVILTTNRIDLVDEAIVDRFLSYEFAAPPVSVLEQIARDKGAQQRLDEGDLQPIEGHTNNRRGKKHPRSRAHGDAGVCQQAVESPMKCKGRRFETEIRIRRWVRKEAASNEIQ